LILRRRAVAEEAAQGEVCAVKGTAEEVAACALFLARDEARYVTWHTLNVNGGMVMI
jgi:NAD(P)-dependent dehydrogenase (short-subunit alcohol dehydrogenase family)